MSSAAPPLQAALRGEHLVCLTKDLCQVVLAHTTLHLRVGRWCRSASSAIRGDQAGPDREPRRRRRATYNRYGGVRHLFAALELAKEKLYGHIKPVKRRTQFLEFCRYLRTWSVPSSRQAAKY